MKRLFCLALLGAAASAAAADEFPKLRPGLWEMTTTSTRAQAQPAQAAQPARTTLLCLDASVQQEMYRMSMGMMAGMCSRHDFKYAAGKVTTEATCDMGGTKMESKAVMTLQGDTAYRTEAHATFDPPMMGSRESTSIIEGRHVGPCKPGQKPGDMTLPTGQTLNIRQMMNGKN